MMPSSKIAVSVLLMLALGWAQAQALRDPTVPPAELAPGGDTPNAQPVAAGPGVMAVIVRNGRPYLVAGTRLYAQGEQFGNSRIERISETEVWLREGRVLRKLPRFVGIQRSVAQPTLKNDQNDSKKPYP